MEDTPDYESDYAPTTRLLNEFTNGNPLADAVEERRFTFDDNSRYNALGIEDDQYDRIRNFEDERGAPVHYMFYNPLSLPETTVFPGGEAVDTTNECEVGARVVPSEELRTAFTDVDEDYNPTYRELVDALGPPFDQENNEGGWRIERFVADHVLDCDEGYFSDDPDDDTIQRISNVYERTAPIWAAIAVTIDAPE